MKSPQKSIPKSKNLHLTSPALALIHVFMSQFLSDFYCAGQSDPKKRNINKYAIIHPQRLFLAATTDPNVPRHNNAAS